MLATTFNLRDHAEVAHEAVLTPDGVRRVTAALESGLTTANVAPRPPPGPQRGTVPSRCKASCSIRPERLAPFGLDPEGRAPDWCVPDRVGDQGIRGRR